MAQARAPQPPETPPSLSSLSGGPGIDPAVPPEAPTGPEAPQPPAPPAGTSVKIGGRDYTVEPELAAALEGREREFNQRLSEQGRELGELRTWRRQVEQQIAPPRQAQGYDYDTALFERPGETLQRIKQETLAEVRREYQAEQAQRQQWDRFYRDHPDLADETRLVRAVAQDLLNEGWAERAPSDIPAFMDELAKQARGELLRMSRKIKEADVPAERLPRGRGTVEGGGGPRREPAPAEPAAPVTLTSLIQADQQRRSRRAVAE